MKKFVIIDGNSFAHRAYHAIKNRDSSERIVVGVPTMLKNVINAEKPDFFVIAFDPANDGNFRKELYKEYKANREESPRELSLQIKWLQILCDNLGYPTVCVEGYEGDDVIGTLAKKGEKAKMNTVIYTSDKDMSQLVSEYVSVYNTGKKEYITKNNFESIYNIKIENFIDYLALEGDSIDNIPGIPHCGPKTTIDLLNNIGSVENILLNKEKIKEVIKRNKENVYKSIIDNEEQLILNKKLATIVIDLNIELKIKDIKFKNINEEKLNKYLNYYNLERNKVIPEYITSLNTQNFIDKKKELNKEKSLNINKNRIRP